MIDQLIVSEEDARLFLNDFTGEEYLIIRLDDGMSILANENAFRKAQSIAVVVEGAIDLHMDKNSFYDAGGILIRDDLKQLNGFDNIKDGARSAEQTNSGSKIIFD